MHAPVIRLRPPRGQCLGALQEVWDTSHYGRTVWGAKMHYTLSHLVEALDDNVLPHAPANKGNVLAHRLHCLTFHLLHPSTKAVTWSALKDPYYITWQWASRGWTPTYHSPTHPHVDQGRLVAVRRLLQQLHARRLGRQRQSSHGIHDKVHPEELKHIQRLLRREVGHKYNSWLTKILSWTEMTRMAVAMGGTGLMGWSHGTRGRDNPLPCPPPAPGSRPQHR